MIISHRHRYVFFEVPHTASTTISGELRELYDGQRILHKHANYSEFRKFADREVQEYFKFAAVRNPLDAVVTDFSKYLTDHNRIFTRPDRRPWVTKRHMEQFEYAQRHRDFSKYLLHFHCSTYNNWYLVGHRHFDFVMRYENITDDFSAVLNRLGLQQVRSLPVINKSCRPDSFTAEYTTDARARAVSVFGPFMEMWRYSFPEDWEIRRVPWTSKVAFWLKERAVNHAADYFSLNGESQVVKIIRRMADMAT